MPIFALQKDVQAAIAIPNPTFRQVLQAHSQFHFQVSPGTISMGNPPKAHGLAGASFRHFKDILIVTYDFSAADRLHHFFLKAS